jgi:hypothetical protein
MKKCWDRDASKRPTAKEFVDHCSYFCPVHLVIDLSVFLQLVVSDYPFDFSCCYNKQFNYSLLLMHRFQHHGDQQHKEITIS